MYLQQYSSMMGWPFVGLIFWRYVCLDTRDSIVKSLASSRDALRVSFMQVACPPNSIMNKDKPAQMQRESSRIGFMCADQILPSSHTEPPTNLLLLLKLVFDPSTTDTYKLKNLQWMHESLTYVHNVVGWRRVLNLHANTSNSLFSSIQWARDTTLRTFTHEPRTMTMKLWEPKRKRPKSVPRHLQNHVVWSWTLKCSVKPSMTGPSTKCYFNKFLFMWSSCMIKIE